MIFYISYCLLLHFCFAFLRGWGMRNCSQLSLFKSKKKMYFYIKMSSVIIVGKILTAYITMAIWIGKQKFSVQKVISIKLLVTLPKTSSEFHRMTQISHKTKKSPAFVIASFQFESFNDVEHFFLIHAFKNVYIENVISGNWMIA